MTIVQIGANNGIDSCSDFVIKNKERIKEVHLVEPLQACNEHIKKVYKDIPNVKIYNLAISENPILKEMSIYYPKHDNTSGHSSSNYGHLTAHSHSEIEFVTVPCFTLEAFLLNNGITACDRLYIDTEGLDCKILLGFDFNKYGISYVEFEIIHADGTFNKGEIYNKCVAKFIENGYRIETAGEFNECAIKND
jgi:FkbM family methyltransferase